MDKPTDLKCDGQVVNVCCHPVNSVMAVGDIDGEVSLHSFSPGVDTTLLKTFHHHKRACRRLRFSDDGQRLYSAGKDKRLIAVDVETGKLKKRIKKAHESAIYSLYVTGDNFVATGDDDGRFKLWDMRTKTAIMDVKESDEFISDMVLDDERKILVATNGEGTLTAFNIRRKRMETQSELFDSEFLSLAKVKRERKVVCGTGDGVINIFNWGEWGNMSDRFPGHPDSIDRILPITDDIVCTGSMDGKIRAVSILPNRFLGVIGQHEKYPIEDMSLTSDRKFLTSCSHDQKVKFWSMEGVDKLQINAREKAKKSSKNKALKSTGRASFFSDLVDNSEEEEESKNQKILGNESDSDSNDSESE